MSAIYGPGGNSPGTNLNRLMDSVGFPDKLGDMYGAALDAAIGNNRGVARNLFDAFSPLSTKQLDRMMSGGFAPPGFCNRPHEDFAHHFAMGRHTHYERESINTFDTGGIFDRKGGVQIDGQNVDIKPPLPKGISPKQFEEKLMGDPNLRSQVERQVGGRVVYDGNADGRITVAKQHYHPCLPFQNAINQNAQGMLGRLLNPAMPQQILGNLAGFLNNVLGGGQGGPGGAGQAGGPGGAGQAGGSQQAGGAGGKGNASDILNNPNLSFEEKLFQFMLLFAEKKQKEIEDKMKEMDAAKNANKAGGAGGGKKAGGAGGAKGGGKSSPIGKIAGAVGGVAQGLMGGLAGGPMGAVMGNQVAGGGEGGDQAGGAGGKKSEETLQAELQRLQSSLQQMFSTISKMEEGYSSFQKQVAQSLGA